MFHHMYQLIPSSSWQLLRERGREGEERDVRGKEEE